MNSRGVMRLLDAGLTEQDLLKLKDDIVLHFGTGSSSSYDQAGDIKISHNGTYLGVTGVLAAVHGPWSNGPIPSALDPNYHYLVHEFYDDFKNPASATASDYHAYTASNDGATGTNAFQDAAGGWFNLVTAAADNDYHAFSTVTESFLFASGKKLWFEARFKLSEATTNDSAWWFGLTDTLTTGGFQADALGPLGTYDGAMIWKDEDTLEIDFETSNAATQATTSNFGTFASNTTTRVGFYFDGTATTSVVTPYVAVADTTWVAGTAQNITLSGLEEMHLVFGVKAGPGAAAETLQVDYVRCIQLR